FAVLVVFAVALAQEWMREAVVAVHHLGEKISFDAVQAAIDLGLHVAVGGDHAPSLVATMTPQPVPQKRQGALFHFNSVTARSVTRFCAASGVAIPPAAAAIAAASNFRNARRSTRLWPIAVLLSCATSAVVGSLEHQRRGHDVGHH